MLIKKYVVLAVASYVGALCSFGGDNEANAASRRLHAAGICHETYPWDKDFIYHTNEGIRSFRAAGDVTWVTCSVPSDTTLAHNSVVTLNIHGNEPAGADVYSQACSKTFNTISSTCGPIKTWGSGQLGATNLDVSAWSSSTAFPYFLTNLRNGDLYGYYISS